MQHLLSLGFKLNKIRCHLLVFKQFYKTGQDLATNKLKNGEQECEIHISA